MPLFKENSAIFSLHITYIMPTFYLHTFGLEPPIHQAFPLLSTTFIIRVVTKFSREFDAYP